MKALASFAAAEMCKSRFSAGNIRPIQVTFRGSTRMRTGAWDRVSRRRRQYYREGLLLRAQVDGKNSWKKCKVDANSSLYDLEEVEAGCLSVPDHEMIAIRGSWIS